MSLKSILASFPKPPKKVRERNLKILRKKALRIAKFNRRKGCYVISTGQTKCLDCGHENYGHRLGCGQCRIEGMKKGVVWGACLNTGPIGKERMTPTISTHDFISYKDLHNRIVAGERFFDIGSETELTVKNFE